MITIHFSGHRPADLVRELGVLVGDVRGLRTTSAGVTVPDHIAYEWLSRRANGNGTGPVPERGSEPLVEVTILPPAFVAIAAAAEDVGGLKRPIETPEPSPSPRRPPGRPRKEIR